MFLLNGKNLVWSSPGAREQNWGGALKPAPILPAASDVSDAVVVAPPFSVARRPLLAMARAAGESGAASKNGAAPANDETVNAAGDDEADDNAGVTDAEDAQAEDADAEDADAEDAQEFEEADAEESRVSAKDAAKAAFLKVLQRAKEGDRKAFEEIYNLYHRRIYNAVYGMLSDADDAQDVTQDVFIRLHDALPTLRADEAFSTYLYRIALNLCRDRARRKKRVRFQSMDTPRAGEEGDVEPMEFPDAGKLPEEFLTGDELQTRVREAVQTLSEDHKAVIMMHHFQGMEVNDIANILDVPSGTVKSRLARGRDQLHRKLRTYLDV